MGDVQTMIWKEWRELLRMSGSRRGALMRHLFSIAVIGVLWPWQFGLPFVQSALGIAMSAMTALMYIAGAAPDAFAGERERHTLETLLASRMSDRAILLSKLIVIVGYAWGLTLASLLLGVVTANLALRHGRWMFYGPFGLLLEALALSLLTSVLAASVGVLISLRSATARQAQQTIGVSTLVLFAALLLAAKVAPAQVLLSSTSNAAQFWLIPLAVCAALDVIALGATFISFQRARLI